MLEKPSIYKGFGDIYKTMAIQKGSEILKYYSFNRQSLYLIKQEYGINKGDFEVLCTGYDLQQPKEPYFFAPDVLKRMPTVNQHEVYKYLRVLEQKGFIQKSSFKLNKRHYYQVTGSGEYVLRFYIKLLNQLITS